MSIEILQKDEVGRDSLVADKKKLQRVYLQQLGENLRKARIAKGFSLRGLGKACSLDYSDIGKIEKGRINIGIVKLLELSKALEVEPATLLKVSDQPQLSSDEPKEGSPDAEESPDVLEEPDPVWQTWRDDNEGDWPQVEVEDGPG